MENYESLRPLLLDKDKDKDILVFSRACFSSSSRIDPRSRWLVVSFVRVLVT